MPEVQETQFRSRLDKNKLEDQENRFLFLSKELPSQLPRGKAHEIAMAAQENVASGSKSTLIGTFILNLFLGAAMNELWSAINAQ